MGLISFMERLGGSMIGLLLKLFVGLIAIIFLIALVQGMIIYWPLMLGMIIGMAVSKIFYMAIEHVIEAELPDMFHLGFDELADAAFLGKERKEQIQEELDQKYAKAVAQVQKMRSNLTAIRNIRQQELDKMKLAIGKDKEQSHVSGRIKDGIRAMITKQGYGKQLKHLERRNFEVDWDEYL